MKIIYDDLFKNKCTYTIVTTNSSFDKSGKLVMGKGAALELKRKYPAGVDIFSMLALKKMDAEGYYGLILDGNVGIFQVKNSFALPAKLDLIKRSTYELIKYAKSHLNWTFAMNFPGIGAGELNIDDVMPIVSKLPDNV
jgi:hypothetical protein